MDDVLAAKAAALGFPSPHKYGDIERERRWLCGDFPAAEAAASYMVQDLYVAESSLRLRAMRNLATGETAWKLSRKADLSPERRIITTLYLTEAEYALMAGFPGSRLRKTRHRLAIRGAISFSVDVFEDALTGLVLAEAEFKDDAAMASFAPPSFVGPEVTEDIRHTGGWLASKGRPADG